MSGNNIWYDEADKLYAELRGQGHSATGAYELELMKVEAERQTNAPRPRKIKPVDKAKHRAKRKLQRKARKASR